MSATIARRSAGIVIVLHALTAVSAAAQETRFDAIARAQAEKAKHLQPYTQNKAERVFETLRRKVVDEPGGFYPTFDSVYSGGGFTLGAGYRQFYRDQTLWYTRGMYSLKNYKLFEVGTDTLGLKNGRVDLRAVAGWRDATEVAFYGVGGDTSPDGKSNFELKQAYVGAAVTARGPGAGVFNAGVRYEDFTLESGNGASPSIEDVYTADTAPGLGTNPDYVHMTFSGGIDSRPSPGYARRGGLYALTYEAFVDRAGDDTFDVLQAEIVHHVPVLRENWVFSMHGLAKTVIDNDDAVPYFLLPSLGSGSTLRAYPSWRFRDRHSLLLTGEWRWMPSLFLDLAIFYDAGKVTSRREDLNFEGLKHNWGIGARFHSPTVTPLRIELARGSEGFNLVFSGAAAF